MEQEIFTIRMMYKRDLATAYGISMWQLRKMLTATATALAKQNNNVDVFGDWKCGYMLTSKQVELLVKHNGPPYKTITE